jgi:hypothetical protein
MTTRDYFNLQTIDYAFGRRKTLTIKEIHKLEPNYLLNMSEEDLVRWLADQFRMNVPIILDNEIYATDLCETYTSVAGTKVTLVVPFEGDAEFFDTRPSDFSLLTLAASIVGNEFRLEYEQAEHNGEILQRRYSADITRMKEYLGSLRRSAESFNNELVIFIRQSIAERKNNLLAGTRMVASLGLPIKRREGAPTTYAVPVKRLKPRIEKPKVTSASYQPEPTLALEVYETILSIMKNMVFVMEKSPSAFESLGEEDLRFHFLVQLNAQYEWQATGETFNFQGKTDILVSADGKNVFIAECKFWDGEKKFLETIDQLLSYLSWRDTKTAVLIFNRRANFSDVLSKIAAAAPSHSCFKRDLSKSDETTFRYIFHQPNDPSRELRLTVMAFDVPVKKKG